jgi:Pyruvate/2-oxoacid:ferredoxin oxidoreductase delta subunit
VREELRNDTGLAKSQWHLKARTREEFPELLVDLYGALRSVFSGRKMMLHLADGIIGMEGDGPGASGTPRRLNTVLAGIDAVAVDRVAARITGLDSGGVATISSASARGLGAGRLDDIKIEGEALADMIVDNFSAPATRFLSRLQDRVLGIEALRNLCVERPEPLPERCTLCYQCKRICPAGAIGPAAGESHVPRYDYTACIRCYCCMEICPEAAIRLGKGKLQWIMDRL